MKRLVILSLVLIACGLGMIFVLARAARPPSITAVARTAPDAVYTVRGRIVMLPMPGKPGSELQIRHEPIGSFVNPNGAVGMPAMTMPFPTHDSLDDFEVGDAIEFKFAVWTTPGSRGYEAREIRKLPRDTRLSIDG